MTILKKPVSIWTKEWDATILRLRAAGMSSRQIARQLGPTITRNQVIGRLSRLSAPRRLPPACQKARKRPVSGAVKHQRMIAPEIGRAAYDENPALDASGAPYTTLTVRDQQCRWIPGEPSPHAPMCGQPVKSGSSYCEHHFERSRVPKAAQVNHTGRSS